MMLFWVAPALVVLGAVVFVSLIRTAVRRGSELAELQQYLIDVMKTSKVSITINARD